MLTMISLAVQFRSRDLQGVIFRDNMYWTILHKQLAWHHTKRLIFGPTEEHQGSDDSRPLDYWPE